MTDPVLYGCTKCGGANYGCKCEGLNDCTIPLYDNRAAIAELVSELRRISRWINRLPIPTTGATAQMIRIAETITKHDTSSTTTTKEEN